MYYVIYQDRQRHWRWRLNAANHKTIADSGEGYWNKSDCQNAINLVKSSYIAPVIER
ncbi:MAG: YegP family protein [Gammaproteobacteria bacterium]